MMQMWGGSFEARAAWIRSMFSWLKAMSAIVERLIQVEVMITAGEIETHHTGNA